MASWVYSVPSRPLESNYSRPAEIITCCCCSAWPVHNPQPLFCGDLLEIASYCLRLWPVHNHSFARTCSLKPRWQVCYQIYWDLVWDSVPQLLAHPILQVPGRHWAMISIHTRVMESESLKVGKSLKIRKNRKNQIWFLIRLFGNNAKIP